MLNDAAAQREPPPDLGACTTSTHRDGKVYTLCLHGELDVAADEHVQAELDRIQAAGARSIVIDLTGLTFMDSTGVRLILRAQTRARADKHDLLLRRGPAAVQRVFTLAGVDDRLPFTD